MGKTDYIRKIYHSMPDNVVKRLSTIPQYIPNRILYGQEYKNWRRFLEESQHWSEDKKHDYEIKKLTETLTTAYTKTVYYKKLFDECGFDINTFHYFDQMQVIPFLTKNLIQEHIQEMVNSEISPRDYQYMTTGGSTGIPMGFYTMNRDAYKESAFIDHMWSAVGYRKTDRIAVLRGAYRGEQGPYLKVGNRLMLSSYHMNEADMVKQYAALMKFKPRYLHVYPSAISILAEYILQKNLPPIPSLRAVLTASENLYMEQRNLISQAFQCPVYDFYGHSEHACMAGGCKESAHYHLFWQYGFTEFGRDKETAFEPEDHELVELVATTYDNLVMPLIRYRTMDMAVYSQKHCACGKNYKVLGRIEGRLQEMLITPSGRKISMTAINMHDRIFDHVKQFQFYQDSPEYCVFNVVRGEQYDKADEEGIYKGLMKKLGDLKLRIQYVDEIPRTESGKYRFLVQKLER